MISKFTECPNVFPMEPLQGDRRTKHEQIAAFCARQLDNQAQSLQTGASHCLEPGGCGATCAKGAYILQVFSRAGSVALQPSSGECAWLLLQSVAATGLVAAALKSIVHLQQTLRDFSEPLDKEIGISVFRRGKTVFCEQCILEYILLLNLSSEKNLDHIFSYLVVKLIVSREQCIRGLYYLHINSDKK